jgi:hypothetical protein
MDAMSGREAVSPTVVQILRATSWAQAFNFWLQTRGISAAAAIPADLEAARQYATEMAAQAVHEWERVSDSEWDDAERDAAAV